MSESTSVTVSRPVGNQLLATIREENLNVYRASLQRLREDVGQENQIAQDYRGRLIYELLQNADDAMAIGDTGAACIRFILTDEALWVGNSGHPLDEADVRGLCGISASSKAGAVAKRRATIGHKGMGFKSVLEITDAPVVYSTTISFKFGPHEALSAVNCLVDEGLAAPVMRAPVTRFPWPVEQAPLEWAEMRAAGMRTAFCFPLRPTMSSEHRQRLTDALIKVPVTTLIFLKHFRRVEFSVRSGGMQLDMAWTVTREHLGGGDSDANGGLETGVYRVILRPDVGDPQEFLLVHDGDIRIGEHRSGLDEFSWEGVEYTEVSVTARLEQGRPIPLDPDWRKLHVFLPSSEPCPYDLLVSGAFSSNLSRQEIRIEPDERNYNRFLLRQAARLLRDHLLPALLAHGATVGEVLRLLDRRVPPGVPATTVAAQTLYEEVRVALLDLPFVPQEIGASLAPGLCIVPPSVQDHDVGPDFRAVLPPNASFAGRSFPSAQVCDSASARILVDHGARSLQPDEAAEVLAGADPERSRAREDAERGVWVDPVLSVLERLWEDLDHTGRGELVGAVPHYPLCPVSVDVEASRAVHRIPTDGLECFYPPRSLSGEVPLDGLCFLARDLCWGALNPKERNIALREQMEAWQALFGVRDFKFPDVMRASVLPALELDRSAESKQARQALRNCDRLAAICQLAGRTPDRNAPLPYERLGSSRALFNLSRLDVPCRKWGDDQIVWMPAYQVYFGDDWIGYRSLEWVLLACDEAGKPMPEVHLLLEPKEFTGLLDRYRHLKDVGTDDVEFGEDEVGLDEDEEAPLDPDDQARWFTFFSWLGVSSSLRPVHFHDVEDRASGWVRTENLQRPEGWAFQNIPDETWERFVDGVRQILQEKDAARFVTTAPYFYQMHDLEHLVVLLNAASRDSTTQLGRALYEHLARNWGSMERFARLQVAQVPAGRWPGGRTKPPRAQDQELADGGDNFWVRRLREASFCPTGLGPRPASRVWLPTPEVQRRFGYRQGRTEWRYLVPALDVEPALRSGKARGLAQALGVREELTPANFTVDDAEMALARLQELYARECEVGADLRSQLREIIRPAYRELLELLSNREHPSEPPLADAPVLAQDGTGALRFAPAREVFYADRRETRDRLQTGEEIWTFIIEAAPAARAPLVQVFGMRTLEDALEWMPAPGEPSLVGQDLQQFCAGLWELAPYLLARVGAERADDRLVRQDTRRLRRFLDIVEPVTYLTLGCALDGHPLSVATHERQSYVGPAVDDPTTALVVWGEHPWPPDENEAEALASALCEILGASYFESFLALIQAGSTAARDRLLRRAGAPRDVEERRTLLQGDAKDDEELPTSQHRDVKTASSAESSEIPSRPPGTGKQSGDGIVRRTPLLALEDLRIEGQPVLLRGREAVASSRSAGQNNHDAAASRDRVYGGHTDLNELDRLGMSISLAYERNRLRKVCPSAEIFDPSVDREQSGALVFGVSSPSLIDRSREFCPRFDAVMRHLNREFGVSLEWPGFDILSLDPQGEDRFDRLIELKSSGVDARLQEMSWNEWKVAVATTLRQRYFLYLVGNLRSDLKGAVPFVRTVRDPFGQLAAEARVNRTTRRKI